MVDWRLWEGACPESGRFTQTNTSRTTTAILYLIVCSIVVLVIWGDLPGNTIFWREVQNAGHFWAFGVMSTILRVILRRYSKFKRNRGLQSYVMSLITCTAFALLTEGAQLLLHRDAELSDILLDLAGAATFLSISFSYDRETNNIVSAKIPPNMTVIRTISIITLMLAMLPTVRCSMAYLIRDCRFPQLCNFGSIWSSQFIQLENASLSRVGRPVNWSISQDRVALLTLEPSEYPGITLLEPCANWSAFDELRIDLFSESKDTFQLSLRVDDKAHNGDFGDRYTGPITVVPGPNSVRIPIQNILITPGGRKTDVKNISRIILFGYHLRHSQTIFLGSYWLG